MAFGSPGLRRHVDLHDEPRVDPHGQHVAPRIDRFGKQLTPEAFARTYTGVLRAAGYWVGHVGKYDVGAPRPDDYDYLRAYHGRHWVTGAAGERVHVTEQNARDSLEFLKTRPKDKPFALSVGHFHTLKTRRRKQYRHRNGVRNSTLARPFPLLCCRTRSLLARPAAVSVEGFQRGTHPVQLAVRYARPVSGA